MNFILRAYSFLFLVPLTLFFFAVGAFAMLQGVVNLNLDMLPWTGASLNGWILGLSVMGLLSILLALAKKARILYVLYAFAVFGLAVNAVFLSGHRFDGVADFRWGLAFIAGALGAALGSAVHARK